MELRKGQLRYCCNPAWMKNGGLTPWNVSVIFETYKISCLMGGHHMRGGSEYHLKARLYRLEQWSNITLSLRRTYRDYINSVLKSCQVHSLDMRCTQWESGKETCWSQTLRNWKRWTHLKSTQKRLNAKEVSTPMNGDNFIFPIADGTVKVSGGDQRLRTSTLIRDRPDRVCFVLETIRTGAMRVIHIPVKTEESQRLRIKFVLYCPVCALNLKI